MNIKFNCWSLLFCLSVIFCVSCAENEIEPTTIECDFNNISDINESKIITDVNIVSLQETPIIMSSINKMETLDSLIYLLDKNKNSLHIFTKNGKYIHTISNQGRGANEYLKLSDFCIDPQKQTINILSRLDKKVLVYDKFGKKLIGVRTLPKRFCKIMKRKEGYIGYMGNFTEDEHFPYNYWIMDENFAIVGQFGKINTNLESHTSSSFEPFSKYDENLYVLSEFNQEVMCLKGVDNQVSTVYKYDFGKCNLPPLSKSDYTNDRKMFEVKNTYITNPILFQETNKHILALTLYQGQYNLIVYDKKVRKPRIYSLGAYTKKYLFNFGNIVNINETEICTIVDAKYIYDVWKGYNEFNDFEKDYPSQVENLRKDIKTVNEDGNPFLIIYKIQ